MRLHPHSALVAASLAAFLAAGFDLLHSTGEVGATLKNGSGCVCHGFSPSDGVNVWIEGPASVTAGSATAYELVMTGAPAAAAAGFNVAAARGLLEAGDSTSQLLDPGTGQGLELTHSSPKPFTADTVRWRFLYHAPAGAGAETLWSVGNSVDLNGIPSGDAWNFGALKLLAVEPAVGVAEEGWPASPILLGSYPNPFNPRTRLAYTVVAPGTVRLELFSVRGERVATLVDGWVSGGEHVVDWEPRAASGVYLARLSGAGRTVTRKLVLAR